MTERTFERLINLYLDSEISEKDLVRLRREVLRSPKRKRTFDDYVRLHWATRLASFDQCEPLLDEVSEEALGKHSPLHSWRRRIALPLAGTAAACLVGAAVIGLWNPQVEQEEVLNLAEQEDLAEESVESYAAASVVDGWLQLVSEATENADLEVPAQTLQRSGIEPWISRWHAYPTQSAENRQWLQQAQTGQFGGFRVTQASFAPSDR